MTMQHMPQVKTLENGAKYWEHEFDLFTAQVYVPEGKKLAEVVNFGFRAPYVLVFAEKKMSESEAAAFAEEKGFAAIAAGYSGSVVFVGAKDNDWNAADAELFRELIANSKIGQYYKDGVLLSRNRFTGEWGECFIRGAIFRTLIFAYGQAADYVGAYLLQTLEGQYLWGPGEITPMAAVLEEKSAEYGHTICFHQFRLRETQFIKDVIRRADEESHMLDRLELPAAHAGFELAGGPVFAALIHGNAQAAFAGLQQAGRNFF